MSVLAKYLANAGQPDMFAAEPAFDEFAAPDGSIRHGWSTLADRLDQIGDGDLQRAQTEVCRLLEDDGVTYTQHPAAGISIADRPDVPEAPGAEEWAVAEAKPWLLDPVPFVLDEIEWAGLEVGLVQRAELLNLILADLYGPQRLLADRKLPIEAIFGHGEFLRQAVGIDRPRASELFMLAVDLGRDPAGEWKAVGNRTQAPSGAGFAMQNRRVVSRVLPDLYAEAHLHRLTPFFHAMRMALVDAAPSQVEDPRVVMLTPGIHSETAFDQAFLASLLGFPLLEGSDLTVRDGRVWMRVLGKLEQVDVILRRVDSVWSDPLELRPDSRLGVSGLLEAVRQGTVTVVNSLGAGVLENPALLPFLPDLSQHLLGEPLRLPSVETFWAGDPVAFSHIRANLDSLVIRPISRDHGRSVRGSELSTAQREQLLARVAAEPHLFVGQEMLRLSSAPTAQGDQLVPRNVLLRNFAIRRGTSYTTMLGGLGKIADDPAERAEAERNTPGSRALVSAPGAGVTKDVWVIGTRGAVPESTGWLPEVGPVQAAGATAAMVPRVLSDLFWFGRYAERAEDLLRLVLATHRVAVETDMDTTSGHALETLLRAVTQVSATYPGFVGGRPVVLEELRSMLLDRHRVGTIGHSIASLSQAGQGIRDQLSNDVWMVLAGVERALVTLGVARYDQGSQLTDTGERVLSGLLGLTGITSENMVRDPGWYLMDTGRGIERALQVSALLRSTVQQTHFDESLRAETDALVIEGVLTAAETIVTFRRRYRGRARIEPVLELLLFDRHNPRSVEYQLDRIAANLHEVPNTPATARPFRLVDDTIELLAAADPAALASAGDTGQRTELTELLIKLQDQLRGLAEAVADTYLQLPPVPQPLWKSSMRSWVSAP